MAEGMQCSLGSFPIYSPHLAPPPLRSCTEALPFVCACLPLWWCLPVLPLLCPFAALLLPSCGGPAAPVTAGGTECIFVVVPPGPTAAVVLVEELSLPSPAAAPAACHVQPLSSQQHPVEHDRGKCLPERGRLRPAAARTVCILP